MNNFASFALDSIIQVPAVIWYWFVSLNWSADVVTAISICVSAFLFIRNRKLEIAAERQARIGEGARGSVVTYLLDQIAPLSRDTDNVSRLCSNFHDSVPATLHVPSKTRDRINYVWNAALGFINPNENKHMFTDNLMFEFSGEALQNRLEITRAALQADKPVAERLHAIRHQLYPILLSFNAADTLTRGLNSYIATHRKRLDDFADLLKFIEDAIGVAQGIGEDVTAASTLRRMAGYECFTRYQRPWPREEGGAEKLSCAGWIDKIDTVISPLENDIGKVPVLTGFLYEPLLESINALAGEVHGVKESTEKVQLMISALLHVVIRDPDSWSTRQPLDEAASILGRSLALGNSEGA